MLDRRLGIHTMRHRAHYESMSSFTKPKVAEQDRDTATVNMHRKFGESFCHVVFEIYTSGRTDTQADTLIAVLRTAAGSEVTADTLLGRCY